MTDQPPTYGFAALQEWAIQARAPAFLAWSKPYPDDDAAPRPGAPRPGTYRLVSIDHRFLLRPQRCVAAFADVREARDALADMTLKALGAGELNWQRAARVPRPPAACLLAPYRVVYASGTEAPDWAAPDEAAAACCALAAAPRLGLAVWWAPGRRRRRLVGIALCDTALCLVHETRGQCLPAALAAILESDTHKDIINTSSSRAGGGSLRDAVRAAADFGLQLRGAVDAATGARNLGFRTGVELEILVGWAIGVVLTPGDRPAYGSDDIIAPLTGPQCQTLALGAVVARTLAVATAVPHPSSLLRWVPGIPEVAPPSPEPAQGALPSPEPPHVPEPPHMPESPHVPESPHMPEAAPTAPKKETAATRRRRRYQAKRAAMGL